MFVLSLVPLFLAFACRRCAPQRMHPFKFILRPNKPISDHKHNVALVLELLLSPWQRPTVRKWGHGVGVVWCNVHSSVCGHYRCGKWCGPVLPLRYKYSTSPTSLSCPLPFSTSSSSASFLSFFLFRLPSSVIRLLLPHCFISHSPSFSLFSSHTHSLSLSLSLCKRNKQTNKYPTHTSTSFISWANILHFASSFFRTLHFFTHSHTHSFTHSLKHKHKHKSLFPYSPLIPSLPTDTHHGTR